ncbi:MAG: alpha/beta hydrolase-fold protein [Actinomycetota bacterium]|nr:alpha/beta hydrolase-fold protein [Actinomycetota bacterium]
MIEVSFQLPDPRRRLAAVRLAHELRDRLPHELTRRGRGWELTAPAPDVARFEYQLELIDKDGSSEWIVDPANPKTASGPWGDKSVWEAPGYEPPEWVTAEPATAPEAVTIPSRILKTALPALVWAHPDATDRSPMLVAHDGPEYVEHSALLAYLRTLPPLRAILLGPVDRNETYSASAKYARALAEDILPQLPPAPARIGLGASLGALALFHAHRRHPESFDALFLQSGSFFRRADAHERWFARYERIARFVGGVHRNRPERTIPIVLGCGTVEENLPANRALEESLRKRGYDARLHEFRDGHNWIAWRDSFHPHLHRLLQRLT